MLVPTPRKFATEYRFGEVRRLALFGSTGSIGTSTLDVVRKHRERFEVTALCAGKNVELLAKQIQEFRPSVAVIAAEEELLHLRELLGPSCRTEILAGEQALVDVAKAGTYDLMVAAIVGAAGLPPVLAALEAGKCVALANKESLVAAGALVRSAVERSRAALIPIDSEHSAIFQALQGVLSSQGTLSGVQSLILTASGGPFLRHSARQLEEVTPEEAVKHPRWSMGAKISVDSATMVNKALELIEAHWLFGTPPSAIQVVVHPQSILHSAVEFADGSVLGQLSVPDMKGPIAFALNYPNVRLSDVMPRLPLAQLGRLDFEALDDARFPAVQLARRCLERGGASSAVFNMANEAAVAAFLQRKIKFTDISRMLEQAVERFHTARASDLPSLLSLQAEVREHVLETIP